MSDVLLECVCSIRHNGNKKERKIISLEEKHYILQGIDKHAGDLDFFHETT
jgi:hypothetical protein